ncbi:hypothetical protein GCM10022268_24780 [Sphingomonas cynarae]|uniref:Uncharacterized protein n=2 Tax=Sphingomonas cynarae TaxID=930197 RepID=A0ABP7E9H7_9SPHN
MATIYSGTRTTDHRFFVTTAYIMAGIIVAGFGMQWLMGRSSFRSPPMLHVHALVFMGWTMLYVVQNHLVGRGSVALHRQLGWIGAGWAVAVMILGLYMTAMMVRQGRTPFFFQPGYFLFMNWLTVLGFGALTVAAIRLRRRTDWHRRLMLCGMAILTGPAFGRLLPMPLLIPFAAWGVFVCVMLFPIAGMVADVRRYGAIHRAWWWGAGTIAALQLTIGVVAFSPFGLTVYRTVTAGAAGETAAPLVFPPFPGARPLGIPPGS